MSTPIPPNVDMAYQQLEKALEAVKAGPIDLMKAPWADIEKAIIPLLGGAFDPRQPQHQAVALGVAAILGKRLAQDFGAFYAMNRESPDGLVLGFPDALITLSPFSAVVDALSRANLPLLDGVSREIQSALGAARLSVQGASPRKLSPDDYERLFDPGFVQFVSMDGAKLKQAWEEPASNVVRTVRDGISRATDLPPDVAKQIEQQIVGSLSQLDPQKTLMEQAPQAARLVELAGHLIATKETTRPAPEDFWGAVVFPVLFIGNPAKFPPIEEEEKQALAQGMDPLLLYVEVVPYQVPVDEGLMGAFGQNEVGLPHPGFRGIAPLRLLAVRSEAVGKALAAFDANQSIAAFNRFRDYLKQETGKEIPPGHSDQVMKEITGLLEELKKVWGSADGGLVAMRRLTEAEAASEGALERLRKAIGGPRIILA